MVWHRTLLFIALIGLILINLNAVSAASTNITVNTDTYVYEFVPHTSYDGLVYLQSGLAAGLPARERYVYLDFDLSTLPTDAAVTSAILHVHQRTSDVDVTKLDIYRVTSTWTAPAVTWNTKPTHVATNDNDWIITHSGTTGWHDVDVTNTVRGWENGTYTNYGLSIWNVTSASPISPGFNATESVGRHVHLEITYIIPASDPINLQHTTGNFWVNYTWDKGTNGKNIDSFNVSQNGTWVNGTTVQWNDSNVGHHGTSTIKVYAFNSTDGVLSANYLYDSVTVANSLPTIVSKYSPSSNFLNASWTVPLNVTGTDLEGDSLTYHYFGGESLATMAYLGANDSIHNNSYNWTVSKSIKYYWYAFANDTYDNGTASSTYSFSMNIAPNLTLPANANTTYTTYPPLTSDITFSCTDLSAEYYRIVISEDSNFNIIVLDTHVSTNTSTQTLIVNEEYYWKVYSYVEGVYSVASEIFHFNLTGNTTVTGVAIEGVVYDDVHTTINGAEVIIYNSTWSDTAVTGSNGYYVFENLNLSSVYSLQARADRYITSPIALVTTGANPVTRNFYLLDDLTDTEWWHYVKFTVQNFWGRTYSDVAVNVYEGDSLTTYDSDDTGTDGSVTFHLDQNVEYRLTFIHSTYGIDQEFIVFPVANRYIIQTNSFSWSPEEPVGDTIRAQINGVRINSTHGYINFTWTDVTAQQSDISYWINNTDGSILYSTSLSTINMSNSQIVDATNDRYLVHFVGIHPVEETLEHTQTISFHGGRRIDLGWPSDWMYAVTSSCLLIFIASMFGAKTAHYGAVTVVLSAWFFKWIGWFTNDNTSLVLLILATVVAIGWVLRKGEEVKP